jgi:hypothetical protein
MTTDDHLAFLRRHQPMPPASVVAIEECDGLLAAVRHFTPHPDRRCVPVFVGAVGAGTGLGMNESVSQVLQAHDPGQVVASLRAGQEGSDAAEYRCIWWGNGRGCLGAGGFVRPLARHHDEDVREAPLAFLELIPPTTERRRSGGR